MPQVSVIIPTYNHAAYVLETLESVFAQTYRDYEVIVVNDGSPDRTAELLSPLASSGRIRYIEQANAGQAAARNRGLAEARGQYVAFLDDDDTWPPDKLEWQVAVLDAELRVGLVYGYSLAGTERWPGPDNPAGLTWRDFMLRNHIRSPGQTLIRRATIDSVGGFDKRFWGADDWDLYLRLMQHCEFRYVDRLALYYRLHRENASRDALRMMTNVRRVFRRHIGILGVVCRHSLWREGHNAIRRRYSVWLTQEAHRAEAAGDLDRSRRCWRTVARLDPGLLLKPAARRKIVNSYVPWAGRAWRAIRRRGKMPESSN